MTPTKAPVLEAGIPASSETLWEPAAPDSVFQIPLRSSRGSFVLAMGWPPGSLRSVSRPGPDLDDLLRFPSALSLLQQKSTTEMDGRLSSDHPGQQAHVLGISGQLRWIEEKPPKMNFSEGVTVPEDKDV